MREVTSQLRSDRGGLLGWSIGLFALTLAVAASYGAIKGDLDSIDKAVGNYTAINDALGVDSLTTPDGYFRSNSVALFPLLLGIYGGLVAIKHLAGAEEAGQLDHLLARPISRVRFFLTTAFGVGIGQFIILGAAAVGAVLGYVVAGEGSKEIWGVFAMTWEVLPIALAHVALGLLAGAVMHRRGPAVGITLGVVVGGWAIDLISKLVQALSWLQWTTLYGYWSRSDWYNGHVDAPYLVVSLLVIVAAVAAAAWWFQRKDLFA